MTSRLGRTNIRVPTCGFGGIPVGRDHLTDAEGADLVRRAIDGGVTLIDTFSNYGRSEIRIGMALKGRRERIVLITKSRATFTPKDFTEMAERSLKNLQVDCLDVLLLKNIDGDEALERLEETAGAVERLVTQGKVRYTGLSSHSPNHARRALESGLLDVAEVPYNYANRHFEGVLDLAGDMDLGVLAMKPLGGGRLFPDVQKGAPETLDTLVDALSFSLSHPSNPVLIPGIGSEAELDRYLEAMPKVRRLEESERETLSERALQFGEDFCRACGYCSSVCPAEIPIDQVLPLLDRAKHVRTDGTYGNILKGMFLDLGVTSDACTECRTCIEECPYNLPIPERLREAFSTFADG